MDSISLSYESLSGIKRVLTVHGWGCDQSLWQPLKNEAYGHNWINVGPNYIGLEQTDQLDQPDLLIAHSLGLTWALKNKIIPRQAIIAINSFTAFSHFTLKQTLAMMQRNLNRKPDMQMKAFWSAAEITPPSDTDINIPSLQEGLNWLQNEDITQEIVNLSCPILVLAGAQDTICPIDALKQQWQNHDMIIHPKAGHALPQTHPGWCAQQINKWLQDI